jgi:hypothetical protein
MPRLNPAALRDARIELHYAAQVVAACADVRLVHRDDDSHTAMRWQQPRMIGHADQNGVAVGVDCAAFAIVVLDRHDEQLFPLTGRTLAEALQWADTRYGPAAGAKLRSYDLPESPLRNGAAFVRYPDAMADVAFWYQVGYDALATIRDAGRPMIWPHHFDLGVIVDGIGAGLSPGDRYYDEPYFYVTPRSSDGRVPTLPFGQWRTQGWTGAILTATDIGDDLDRARSFIAAAVTALR